MELFCRSNSILFINLSVLEKKLNSRSTHLSVRRLKFWPVVLVLPPSLPSCNFSTTLQNFLPVKLKPLGLSLTGQLRVASQFISIKSYPKKIDITFWLFFYWVVSCVDNFLLSVLSIQPPPNNLSPRLFFE